MGFTTLVALLLLFAAGQGITMSVNSQDDRCMVVFTSSEEDFLKVELKFTRFHEQSRQEGYRIKLRNSETQEEQLFSVEEGTFRKQFQLTPNIAYYLCVKIILEYSRGSEVQEYVEYNSGIKHTFSDHDSLPVPPNLLRTKDLKDSYQHLGELQQLMEHSASAASRRTQEDNSVFLAQNDQMQKLEWLSILELAAVILLGTYQYVRLKDIISSSNSN